MSRETTLLAPPPPPPPIAAATPPSGLGWRLPIVVLAIALLSDLTIYRGEGFGGLAVLFALLPFLMALGRCRPAGLRDLLAVTALLLATAARLAWNGSVPLAGIGFILSLAVAMTLSGFRPYMLDLFAFALQIPIAGLLELARPRSLSRPDSLSPGEEGSPDRPSGTVLSLVLPVIVVVAFSGLFTLANPNLRTFVADRLSWISEFLGDWFRNIHVTEIWFWGFVIWMTTGALRPWFRGGLLEAAFEFGAASDVRAADRTTPLYAPFRNTLVAVIGLFALYLVFEFQTLWFREFPKGFHYSGYAHEGAFWLTVALALATLVISLIFRGDILEDARLPRLKLLSHLWSAQNFLLAVTVYHRLLIYVGFNGMTWMRFVGFSGITAVVLGLVLVLIKIQRGRSFVWLIERQMWTLALVIYAFAMTPADGLAMRYNARRILQNDHAPAVQIGYHRIDSEGLAELIPLLDSSDETIRNGIAALLAREWVRLEARGRDETPPGWTAWQGAEEQLLRKLDLVRPQLVPFLDADKQQAAWDRFRTYVYQWY